MVEPNLQSIVITNAVGIVLLISLLVTGQMARERRTLVDRMFAVMIFVCMGSCIFEPITWLVDGRPEPWAFFLNYLGNTYCYCATAFHAYLWVLYVDLRLHRGANRIERRYPIALAASALMVLAIIGNLCGHYLFVIDENNVYHRLPLSYLNYALLFALLFFSVWLKYKYQRDHNKVRFFPMAMFLVPIFVGSGLQAAIFGVSLAWPSVCIGLTSIHMSQQNELAYIDSLTGLYNRAYMDSMLKTMERKRELKAGIMVDLDFFKQINDRYGHSVGDRALKEIARILAACTPRGSEAIRMAGDEFIILLDTQDEAEIRRVEALINARVAEFNATGKEPYELSLSFGGCLYDPEKDTADTFLGRLDELMYSEKRIKHSQA